MNEENTQVQNETVNPTAADPATSDAAPAQAPDTTDELAVVFEDVDSADISLDEIISEEASVMETDEDFVLSSVIPAHTAVARLNTLKPSVVRMKSSGKNVVQFWQVGWDLIFNQDTGEHTSRSFSQRIYMLKKDGTPLSLGKEQLAQLLTGIVVSIENQQQPELDKKTLKQAKKEALVKIKAQHEGYSLPDIVREAVDSVMILDVTVTPAKGEYDESNSMKWYGIRPVDAALHEFMVESSEQ